MNEIEEAQSEPTPLTTKNRVVQTLIGSVVGLIATLSAESAYAWFVRRNQNKEENEEVQN